MRVGILLTLLLLLAAPARAEWQIKPFTGIKFGGSTNLTTDLDGAAGKRKTLFGISNGMLGDVFGWEIDLAHIGGYFTNGQRTVVSSGVTTLTANAMVLMPRRLSEYTLRPYFVTGAGFLRRSTTTRVPGVYDGARNLPVFDIGGGVTGFISRNVGVSWELRKFRTLPSGDAAAGLTPVGQSERISFWRVNMALAIRY